MKNNQTPGTGNATASVEETFGLNNSTPGQDAAEANITNEELVLLDSAGIDTAEAAEIEAARVDNEDDDGTLLNEYDESSEDSTGNDLDVPGSEADDADETVGSEDEENNFYSLGADKKD